MFTGLETKRLYLKCIGYEDTDFMFRQFSDESVTRYLYDEEPFTSIDEAKGLIDFYLAPEPRNQHRWIITLKDGDAKIGTCGFHCWSRETDEAEIGYDISDGYRNMGYASEALSAILEFAGTNMNLRKISAHIYPENTASVKTAEKAGFVRSGETYIEVFRGEEYVHDIYVLTI